MTLRACGSGDPGTEEAKMEGRIKGGGRRRRQAKGGGAKELFFFFFSIM